MNVFHCMTGASRMGGMGSYVESLARRQGAAVLDTLEGFDQRSADLLHVHEPAFLRGLEGRCPAVFTAHDHRAYCPSGNKFLRRPGAECSMPMSLMGCIRGHLLDRCGEPRYRLDSMGAGLRAAFSARGALRSGGIPVIAPSGYVRAELLAQGLAPDQVLLLRHGVPEAPSARPLSRETHQKRRILFAGRIVPVKGLGLLLRALRLMDGVTLDVAGEGDARPGLERFSREAGLGDRVAWHGWCSRDRLAALYDGAFCLAFPSLWPEPAGLSVLEAYSRRRPVVALRLGGVQEYVEEGRTGLLAQPNDESALAAAVLRLADDCEAARTLGEQAHVLYRERFTLASHADSLQEIYARCVESFGDGAR